MLPAPSVRFRSPQKGGDTKRPLTYTGSPWKLFFSDVMLFFQNIIYIPFIFLPAFPWRSGAMAELYPSSANIIDISFHTVLFITQLSFLISLFVLTYLPVLVYLTYIGLFLGVNKLICLHFNHGIPEHGLNSTEDEYSKEWTPHLDERWIFLNGICVGSNWLQNNVDRLSRAFHRPIVGVHNKTSGVLFDLVQCLIQRSLLYATSDVRDCYVLVKKALYEPGVKKVVLILHSQGGIEGGMIVDWLLDEVPQDLLQYLEVYTFGCLANHFSNPRRTFTAPGARRRSLSITTDTDEHEGAISCIEHYANIYDFASRWGVLNYTKNTPVDKLQNRFMGKVFINPRAGHQLNQHYLDSIFPLDPTLRFTRDPKDGDFMDMDAIPDTSGDRTGNEGAIPNVLRLDHRKNSSSETSPKRGPAPPPESNGVGGEPWNEIEGNSTTKMRDISRLWQYRNSRRPVD